MTCRELLASKHPEQICKDLNDGEICPDDFDYLPAPDYCCNDYDDCAKCWDREVSTEDMLAFKDKRIIELEELYQGLEHSRDDLYKEFTELVKERDELKIKLEETTAEWDHEITCCRNILDDRVEEIERLKLIIRTVELLTGGKILDE